MFNFKSEILQHKKYSYQEGKETDCEFLCANGIVTVSFLDFWSIQYSAKGFFGLKFGKYLIIDGSINNFPHLIRNI